MSHDRDFTDNDAERLFAGHGSGPDGDRVAEWIEAVRRHADTPVSDEVASPQLSMLMMELAVRGVGTNESIVASTTEPRRISMLTGLYHNLKARIAALVLALLTIGGGVAYAGVLPDSVQEPVADAYGILGFDFHPDDDQGVVDEPDDQGEVEDADEAEVEDADEGEVEDTDEGVVGIADVQGVVDDSDHEAEVEDSEEGEVEDADEAEVEDTDEGEVEDSEEGEVEETDDHGVVEESENEAEVEDSEEGEVEETDDHGVVEESYDESEVGDSEHHGEIEESDDEGVES